MFILICFENLIQIYVVLMRQGHFYSLSHFSGQYGKINDLQTHQITSDKVNKVTFYKVGRTVIMWITDLKNLAKGSNVICDLPDGFIPTTTVYSDTVAQDGTSLRIMLRTWENTLDVYNYGNAIEGSTNLETEVMYFV